MRDYIEVDLHPGGALSEEAVQEAANYLQEGYQVREYIFGKLRFITKEHVPELTSRWQQYKRKQWEKRLLRKDAVYQIVTAMYVQFGDELPALLQPYKRINAERTLHKFGLFTFSDKKIERRIKRREKKAAKREKKESMIA